MWFFFMVIFNTVSIIWQNTEQLIPVGDDLSSYKYKPYAELYINQNKVKDEKMYYEYEVEHTFFSVINTNVIGNYTVKYKVYFPTYGFSAVEAISFSVRDDIKPSISAPEKLIIDLGTKNINYEEYITYSDNYNTNEELILTIQSHLVNPSMLGIYPVYINVKDSSNNQSNVTMMVHVVDQIPPSITQKKTIEINVNETIILDNYFTYKDNYDAVFTHEFDDNSVDYTRPGTYSVSLKVTDQSGNQSMIQTYVYIKDMTAPILRLKITEIAVDYQEQLSLEQLKSYIFEVGDDITPLNVDDVIIDNFVDSNYLGYYEVIYEVTDEHQNKTTKILAVTVKDLSDPKIIIKQDIIIDVMTFAPNYLDYLEITDNFNAFSELVIEMKTSEVKVQTIGQYWIYITVKDTSKNEISEQVLVEVADRENPQMILPKTLTVTDFKRPNFESLIVCSDNYDIAPMLTIDDYEITYHIVGEYNININLRDQSNNQVNEIIIVKVIDIYYPVLILYTQQIKHDYTKEPPHYLSYVKEIYDVYDKNLTVDDIVITDLVDYQKLGLYEVIFELTDPQGLKTIQTLFVEVTDFNIPTFEIATMKITQGESFIYSSYVKAFDDYDGDLSHLVNMSPSTIPTHIPGIYEIIFYVYDSAGNYAQEKAFLTITEKDVYLDYVYYAIGIALVLFIYTIYFFYRRRHPKIT